MRLRTLALALILSCGAGGVIQLAAQTPVVRRAKNRKMKTARKTKKVKPFKAGKAKPRKARKIKRA